MSADYGSLGPPPSTPPPPPPDTGKTSGAQNAQAPTQTQVNRTNQKVEEAVSVEDLMKELDALFSQSRDSLEGRASTDTSKVSTVEIEKQQLEGFTALVATKGKPPAAPKPQTESKRNFEPTPPSTPSPAAQKRGAEAKKSPGIQITGDEAAQLAKEFEAAEGLPVVHIDASSESVDDLREQLSEIEDDISHITDKTSPDYQFRMNEKKKVETKIRQLTGESPQTEGATKKRKFEALTTTISDGFQTWVDGAKRMVSIATSAIKSANAKRQKTGRDELDRLGQEVVDSAQAKVGEEGGKSKGRLRDLTQTFRHIYPRKRAQTESTPLSDASTNEGTSKQSWVNLANLTRSFTELALKKARAEAINQQRDLLEGKLRKAKADLEDFTGYYDEEEDVGLKFKLGKEVDRLKNEVKNLEESLRLFKEPSDASEQPQKSPSSAPLTEAAAPDKRAQKLAKQQIEEMKGPYRRAVYDLEQQREYLAEAQAPYEKRLLEASIARLKKDIDSFQAVTGLTPEEVTEEEN